MTWKSGDVEIDPGLFELRRAGETVKLSPKAFDVLLYLVEHRDRVVSKEELLEKLWPGEHVTEAVLPSNMTLIRKALQSAGTHSRFIQTVHGRGYRFTAPVQLEASGVHPKSEATDASVAGIPEQGIFVGREDVMRDLLADVDLVFEGRGRIAMLVGEPGIGKTRTAEEVEREAEQRGAVIAEGRCYEDEGVPPFWPWVQVLRTIADAQTENRLAEQLGRGAGEIATLLPELRSRLAEAGNAIDASEGDERARFRLFDAVSTFLRNASAARPLILFLDDLHWADEPTLQLLQHVAREIRSARVFILCAYRDVELRRHHPLSLVLGELGRQPHLRRVVLRGLPVEDTARFIKEAVGRPAPPSIVRAVFEMTEGNPFFVTETVRLLSAEGGFGADDDNGAPVEHLGLPQGVREVIGRRLDRLSDACNRVLTHAAVVGREFSLSLLAVLTETPRDALLDLLAEAEAALIVESAPSRSAPAEPGMPIRHSIGSSIGYYAFSHALIRQVLYEELSGPQRVRLHGRVATAIESAHGEKTGPHLSELAFHSFQAAPSGDIDRTVDLAVRAAEQALELLAWEEGVTWYERALQVYELATLTRDDRRAELLLGKGLALWRAGNYPRANDSLRQVVDLAHTLRDAKLLAKAVLAMGGWPQFRADEPPGGWADQYRSLLSEALEAGGSGTDEDSETIALRALLVSQLSQASAMEDREEYSQQAVALARESGDADALFGALFSRLTALLGPDDVRSRLEVATELLDLAMTSGSKEKLFMAREARIRSFLALGDLSRADREIEACVTLADELRLPIHRHSTARFLLARAVGDGRLDEAERLNHEILKLGQQTGDTGAKLQFDAMVAWIDLNRGLIPDFQEIFGDSIEAFVERMESFGSLPRAIVSIVYMVQGRPDDARRHLDVIARRGLEKVTRDEAWIMTISVAAEACVQLGELRFAKALYEALLPYADLIVSHQHMRVYIAPVQLPLAGLASLRGERVQAALHFEAAVLSAQRLGARPCLARACTLYADFLESAARPRKPERERAANLRELAEQTLREMGVATL